MKQKRPMEAEILTERQASKLIGDAKHGTSYIGRREITKQNKQRRLLRKHINKKGAIK